MNRDATMAVSKLNECYNEHWGKLGVVAYGVCNPSTLEAEVGGFW